jgi:hypothetical protein
MSLETESMHVIHDRDEQLLHGADEFLQFLVEWILP